MRPGLLILSGFNLRAVVALCRRATAARLPFHLVARNASDPIYLTDYGANVGEERTTAELDAAQIIAWIQRLRAAHGYSRVLLSPSTEFFNRVILRHRELIEAAGGIVPLVERKLYERISDKHAFAELCTAHGIAVPATFERLPAQLPFVAKPRTYGASRRGRIKPYLVHTPDELREFLDGENVGNFFLQEFVEGQSIYLLAHIARNSAVLACAQENLIQQARGGSIVLARPHDFHRHPDAQAYLRLLRGVGFHGLVMIEVRRCARTGRHVMIEANPRLWGPIQFTLDRGVDLLGAFLADHGLTVEPLAPPQPERSHYFWSGGLHEGDESCTFHHYSAAQFAADQSRLAACDLFDRADTRRLYQHELAEVCPT
jgi:predicted ATP-grasp superfamily ATP-dependent carboligase